MLIKFGSFSNICIAAILLMLRCTIEYKRHTSELFEYRRISVLRVTQAVDVVYPVLCVLIRRSARLTAAMTTSIADVHVESTDLEHQQPSALPSSNAY